MPTESSDHLNESGKILGSEATKLTLFLLPVCFYVCIEAGLGNVMAIDFEKKIWK